MEAIIIIGLSALLIGLKYVALYYAMSMPKSNIDEKIKDMMYHTHKMYNHKNKQHDTQI